MRFADCPLRLGCGQDRLPDSLRQRDRAKKRLRIEIIVAGLIHDPDQAMPLGISVANRNVIFRRSSDAR